MCAADREHPKALAQERSGCAQKEAVRGAAAQRLAPVQICPSRPFFFLIYSLNNLTICVLPTASTPSLLRRSVSGCAQKEAVRGAAAQRLAAVQICPSRPFIFLTFSSPARKTLL